MDEEVIRARLNADRAWSVYALGDLAPSHAGFCDWRIHPGGVALIYRAVTPPILFAIGPLPTPIDEPEVQLHLQEDALAALAIDYDVASKPVWRMALDVTAFSATSGGAHRLDARDADAIERLFRSGPPAEQPDFFFPAMLDDGFFRGVWQDGELIAVAGTHVVNPREGVAAIGNVYTHPAHRGRGLARAVTSATAAALIDRGITTVALNVRDGNTAAERVYERLGFRRHCRFFEGAAQRRRVRKCYPC